MHSPTFLQLVADAKQRIHEISIDDIVTEQERCVSFYFVDVREDDEWKQGHAKGAIHIGKGVIERDIETKIPDKESEIVLYCGGGFRSALAADAIQKMGYTRVKSLDGGIRAWRRKGLPEDRDL